jgi:tRNA(Ile)-lysidine synthase
MNTIDKVSNFIAKHQLTQTGKKLIVGLSGGSDSIALTHILLKLGYECTAAHCNFLLRGEESERDERFVREFCRKMDITCLVKKVNTSVYAQQKGISIEMAARELRYAWFEKLRIQTDIPQVAIAHHQDDSIETILLNIIRGTGIRGLTGIAPANGHIIRPMLCLTKEEVSEYIRQNGLDYVDDSSNNENIYLRNKIRHQLLPLLEEMNPSARESISRMSQHLLQVKHIYDAHIMDQKKSILIDSCIRIEALEKSSEPEAILHEILHPFGFNTTQISLIYQARNSIPGKMFFSETHRILKDRNSFIISAIPDTKNEYFLIDGSSILISYPIEFQIETIEKESLTQLIKSANVIYIDKQKVQFPLILRKWKKGDWFVPFGMNGKKKVSDYFSDQKFSILQKEECWILESEGDIIWVVGHRSDNRFRIDDQTKTVLRIETSTK